VYSMERNRGSCDGVDEVGLGVKSANWAYLGFRTYMVCGKYAAFPLSPGSFGKVGESWQ
jgi:hypothetical protein